MIKAELKKVLSYFPMFMLVSMLVLLHTMLIIYQAVTPNEMGYSYRDVGQIYQEMGGNQTAYIENRVADISRNTKAIELDQEAIELIVAERNLISQVRDEMILTSKYAEYLENIEKDAVRLRKATILFQEDSFSARNILDIAEDYSHIEDTSLTWSPSEGVLLVTSNSITDILILICIIFVVLPLTVSERMLGYHPIIHSAPSGCKRSWYAKLITIIILVIAITVLFYGSSCLISYHLIGWGKSELPVQSMVSYYNCPYNLTISQFMTIFIIMKIFAFLILSIAIFAVGCFFCNLISPVGCIIVGAIISYYFWQFVDRSSWFGILKEYNFIALLNTKHYLESSINVNVAGYPLSSIGAGVTFSLISLIVSVPMSKYGWERTLETSYIHIFKGECTKKRPQVSSLGYYEMRKLLVINHAFVILFVMVVALVMGISAPRGLSQTQYYYRQYADLLEGTLSDNKLQLLESEATRIAEANEQIALLSEMLSKDEILPETFVVLSAEWEIPLSKQSAFQIVYNQYMKLQELQSDGYRVEFIDETGWMILFGEWGKWTNYLNGLWIAILLVLAIHNYAVMETSSGVGVLISCSPKGIERTRCTKHACIVLYSVLVGPIPFINQLVQINRVFPLGSWNSIRLSAGSITVIDNIPLWCPVVGYLSFRVISIIVETILCSAYILRISESVKSNVVSLSCSTITLGINFILAASWGYSPVLSGRNPNEIWMMIIELVIICILAYRLTKEKNKIKMMH